MRFLCGSFRRARPVLTLVAGLCGVTSATVADVLSARFLEPTTRYAHGVLGDTIEYGALEITVKPAVAGAAAGTNQTSHVIRLPFDHVFEDIAPRLWDITGDSVPEVVVIETDVNKGAQLAVYTADGTKLTATPHIGTRNRWLAPIGAADLDGDGHVEIAYIDRPHLAKTLRIWRYENGHLHEVGHVAGLTNHRIGEGFITSGLRDCGDGVQVVTANADWTRLIATTLGAEGEILQRDIGPFQGAVSMQRVLSCN